MGLTKDNKTAIRGGFGMFHDRIDETAIVQGGLVIPPFGERIQLGNGSLKDPTRGKPSARGATASGPGRDIQFGLKLNF